MLERLVDPTLPLKAAIALPMGGGRGDNAMGGANQQERLSSTEQLKWFLAGFVEGEGALCVSIKEHPTARFGYYVDPEFFLYQHASGLRILELARTLFRGGRIAVKPGSQCVLVYSIGHQRTLAEEVVPFYERYVARFACKRETFEAFREILARLNRKEHFSARGMLRIVERAYAMNPDGKGRRRLRPLAVVRERILRGHTPDSQAPQGLG